MRIGRRRTNDTTPPDRPAERVCSTCGAANPARRSICARCGRELTPASEARTLWTAAQPAPNHANGHDTVVIDLLPATDPSLQATRPIDITHRFDTLSDSLSGSSPAYRPPTPRGPSGADFDALSRPQAAGVLAPASSDAVRPSGPSGWLLGLIALLIIGGLVAAFGWSLLQPRVEAAVERDLSGAIATQVAAADLAPLRQDTRLVLTEETINASLAEHADDFEPFSNVRARITRDGAIVRFSLYGLSNTFEGEPVIRRGRIVIANPALSGPAGRVLDAAEIAKILEGHLARLMARADVTPTEIRLRDGSLTVITEPRQSSVSASRLV